MAAKRRYSARERTAEPFGFYYKNEKSCLKYEQHVLNIIFKQIHYEKRETHSLKKKCKDKKKKDP